MLVSSADITSFDFAVLFDLSLPAPKVTITNLSTGPNLAVCKYYFELVSPTGIVIYQGNIVTPDKQGVWTTFEIPATIPLVNGHVEWGGLGYSVNGYVKGAAATIHGPVTKGAMLKRPNGNTSKTCNNYGAMNLGVEVKCTAARLYVQDNTNYLYKGLPGNNEISTGIKLIYPGLDPANIPAPYFKQDAFSHLNIPLYGDGKGHQLLAETVRQYNYSDGISVRIKYVYREVFEVDCLTDMCAVIKSVHKLSRRFQLNGCTSKERERLLMINTSFSLLILAKMNPTCCVDQKGLIADIKILLGEDFDCGCHQPTGLNSPCGCVEVVACDDAVTPTVECPSSVTVSNVTATSYQLTWPAVPGATGYQVLSCTSSDGADVRETILNNGNGSITAVISGLTPGVQYWHKVSPIANGTPISGCVIGSATTSQPTCNLDFVQLDVADDDNDGNITFDAVWNGDLEAATYKVDNGSEISMVAPFFPLTIALTAGQHTVTVYGKNANGSQVCDQVSKTLNVVIGAPAPACVSYTLHNTTALKHDKYYIDCNGNDVSKTIDAGVTETFCALEGSVLQQVGVTITNNGPCQNTQLMVYYDFFDGAEVAPDPATVALTRSATFNLGDNIALDISAMQPNQHFIARYPAAERTFKEWTNDSFNFGFDLDTTGDSFFLPIVTVGAQKIIQSRPADGITLNTSQSLNFQ